MVWLTSTSLASNSDGCTSKSIPTECRTMLDQLGPPCTQKRPSCTRYEERVGNTKVDFGQFRVYIVATHDVACWVMVSHAAVLSETPTGCIFHAFCPIFNIEPRVKSTENKSKR